MSFVNGRVIRALCNKFCYGGYFGNGRAVSNYTTASISVSPPIVYNHIRSFAVSGLGFNIIISLTIDNGTQIKHEISSPILIIKFLLSVSIIIPEYV